VCECMRACACVRARVCERERERERESLICVEQEDQWRSSEHGDVK
jgi:hypothetical protein